MDRQCRGQSLIGRGIEDVLFGDRLPDEEQTGKDRWQLIQDGLSSIGQVTFIDVDLNKNDGTKNDVTDSTRDLLFSSNVGDWEFAPETARCPHYCPEDNSYIDRRDAG